MPTEEGVEKYRYRIENRYSTYVTNTTNSFGFEFRLPRYPLKGVEYDGTIHLRLSSSRGAVAAKVPPIL